VFEVEAFHSRHPTNLQASSVDLATTASEGFRISSVCRPLRRGDFQLMSQPYSSRPVSLGVVPLKRVSGMTNAPSEFDKKRNSRAGET